MSSYGSAVIDGRVRYFSATSLSMGDDRDGQDGCQLKYYYRYVEKRVPPRTKSLDIGTKVDEEITQYLATGEKNLGPIAMTALHLMPPVPVGSNFKIQHEIKGILKIGDADVVGKIDLLNLSGVVHGLPEFTEPDPPGTIEIKDWKTTKDWKWLIAEQAMATNTQLVIYGHAVCTEFDVPAVRLSHGTMRTEGARVPARKVSTLVSRERLLSPWDAIEQVGEQLTEVVTIKKAADVKPNLSACRSYGGCPYRTECWAYTQNNLVSTFGPELARFFTGEHEKMSLLDALETSSADREMQIAAMTATLEAREQSAKYTPQFAAAIDTIERAVIQGQPAGKPQITGAAAQAYAALKGVKLEGNGFAGSGQLSKIKQMTTPDEIISLAQQLVDKGYSTPPAEAPPAPSILPPDAPKSNPAAVATADDKPAKRGPGRPPKAPPAPNDSVETSATPVPPPSVKQAIPVVTDVPGQVEGFDLYVNAIPSVPYQSLDAYVREFTHTLAKANGLVDIRLAENSSGLAYGKWKGALAALVQAKPPAPGVYVVLRPDEITEVVCDALRTLAANTVFGVSVR